MKRFIINKERSIFLGICTSDYDKTECPARCSCCEFGDICQIEDKQLLGVELINGFPEWCPLDNI